MFETSSDLISQLLRDTVAELDIPPDLRAAATREYRRAGNWLAAHADGDVGWVVYPQVRSPSTPWWRPRAPTRSTSHCQPPRTTSPPPLRRSEARRRWRTGQLHRRGPPSYPKARSARRTRSLPALPRPLAAFPPRRAPGHPRRPTPTASSSPTANSASGSAPTRSRSPPGSGLQPRPVPHQARPLGRGGAHCAAGDPRVGGQHDPHRVVQVLKLHRNEHFRAELDPGRRRSSSRPSPPSAYRGEQSLDDAMLQTVELMPQDVTRTPTGLWVRNPVEPRENFADRWREHPELARHFFAGSTVSATTCATRRLSAASTRSQRDCRSSFGAQPVEKAVGRLGDAYRRTREAGALTLAPASGLLTTGPGVRVRNHGFYGGSRHP